MSADAGAQAFRGVVLDSTAHMPLPGAVITMLDSSGATVTRSITDASGRFATTLSPRAVRLRVIRIGYRPRDLAVPPAGPQRDTPLQVAMQRLPPMLETVRVSDSELCPGSAERGAAFQLWEQARAGLLATVVARELKPAQATTLTYESGMSPTDERIRRQRKQIKVGQTTRPFIASAQPSFFAHFGYMIEDPSGRVFAAPDADVLVDESFVTTHCFHLQAADAAHRGQIGLAFTPARGRDTLVDVRGVIWVDNQTPQLRSLEFFFTSLEPAAMAMKTGGHIEFRTMENGVAFIERWNLRLPNLQLGTSTTNYATNRTPSGPVPRTERYDVRVAEIVEAGGIVLDAVWPDGARWHDTPAMIVGAVVQRKTSVPVIDGVVSLTGTQDSARTDSTGAFAMAVIPGKYTIVASDTALDQFVAARSGSQRVEVARAATVAVRLEVEPIDGVIAELCRGVRLRDKTSMLVGHVTVTDRALPRDARVRATWQAGVTTAGSIVEVHEEKQEIDFDDKGRFLVCGVTREQPIKLTLIRGNTTLGDTTVTLASNRQRQTVEWFPGNRTIIGATAGLEGTVVSDIVRMPIAGAEVVIPALQRSTTTGADGAFQFSGLSAGTYAIEVRHIGDAQLIDSVRLTPGMRLTRTIVLRRATVLDTVRTNAAQERYVSPALRGFDERRRTGQGRYITDSILRRNDDRRLADVLPSFVNGMRIQRSGSKSYIASTRDNRQGKFAMLGGGGACFATVYLDGTLLFEMSNGPTKNNPPPDLNEIQVNSLAAVEFYAGQSTLPAQFRASECGTLLLWTREK